MSNTEPTTGAAQPPEEPQPEPARTPQAPPASGGPRPQGSPGDEEPPIRRRGGQGLLNASGWTLLLWLLVVLAVLVLLSQCDLFGG